MASPPLVLSHEVHGAHHERAVVLLHSLALDRSVWEPLVAVLAEHRAVVLVDLRGHGASPHDAGFTIEDMADDVARTLDELGLVRVGVVGMSMGGCVAQAFAARHPHRVDALGLIDTTAWYGPGAQQAWEQRAQKARDQGMRSLSRFQLDRWFSEGFLAEHPELGQNLLNIFADNDLDSYVSACRALGAADLREAVTGLDVPTAIVVGEHDPATSPEHAADLQRRIPGATLHVVAGAKHLTPLEAPDEVGQQLLRVLV